MKLLIITLFLIFTNLIFTNFIGTIYISAQDLETQEESVFTFISPRPLVSADDISQIKFNSIGLEVLFSSSGFGLGCQFERYFSSKYRLNYGIEFTGKRNSDELEYLIDDSYYAVPNKVNRLFTIPFNIGIQRQIVLEDLAKSFRPFVGISAIPMLVWRLPYQADFFNEIKYSKFHFRAGGGLVLGADFGAVNTALISFKLKYNYVPWGGNGIESISDFPIKNMGGFFLSLTLGGFF